MGSEGRGGGATACRLRLRSFWTQCRPAWVIFLLAMAVRLLPYGFLVPTPHRFLYGPDSVEYQQLAQNLVAHQHFSLAATPPYTPDLSRTPVFPMLVAGIYALAGRSLPTAILVNICAASLTCGLAYMLGRQMIGKVAGAFAGLALALEVNSVVYANQLLTETLFTLILVLGVFYLWKYLLLGPVRFAAVAGALLGTAALTRPIGALIFLFLAPVFLLFALRRTGMVAAMRDYGIFALCAVFLVALWMGRNYAVAGAPVLTSLGAINAYYHRAGAILAVKEGVPVEGMRERMRVTFDRELPPDRTTVAQRLMVMKQRSVKIIADNIGPYIRLHIQGIARMLNVENFASTAPSQEDGPVPPGLGHPAVRLAKGIMQVLLYLFALIGAVEAFRQKTYLSLFLLLSLIGYFLLLSGPEAYSRFQVPVIPFICILSGFGAGGLWQGLRSHFAWVECE